jgi:archaemetzincin
VPNAGQRVIYLQPIGEFDALQAKAIDLTREYVEIFFQRKTKVLPAISDANVPADSRRENSGHEQLKTGYILNRILAENIPNDAMAVMVISQKDLYPDDDWNYVFGQASYSKRIGVTSIFRLENEKLQNSNFGLCLRRLASVSTHEIGHMLTLHHCLFAKCTMNGSNNLEETDASPMRLCSDCQTKLTWNLHYDNKKRSSDLCAFARLHDFEDAGLLAKDVPVESRLPLEKPR